MKQSFVFLTLEVLVSSGPLHATREIRAIEAIVFRYFIAIDGSEGLLFYFAVVASIKILESVYL
jgi:hypothetical protein